MCGRYYVEPESDMEELAELIAEAKRKSDEVKTGEVFPSDTAAVIIFTGLFLFLPAWGLWN